MTGCGIMSSVWDMILQCGSTIKVSTELPVTTRHRCDMTEKLLKVTLNPNSHTHAIFGMGMPPVTGGKTGQIKSQYTYQK